jgi:hypothetical protein
VTRPTWSSPTGPFGSEELSGVQELDPEQAAIELEIGRALERLAARDAGITSDPFSDRVMTAIAAEPRPAPAVAAAAALRGRRGRAFVGSLVDAWRVTFGGGRPVFLRIQALAVVGLLLVALAGAVVGAGSLLGFRTEPSPSPSVVPSPPPVATPSPSPSSPSVEPSESPSPDPSAAPSTEPSASPGATDEESTEPTEAGDDDSGPESGGSGPSDGSGSRSGSGSGSSGSDSGRTGSDDRGGD